MTGRGFRRQRPWRAAAVVVVGTLLVIRACQDASSPFLDPIQSHIESGEYQVAGISPDAHLEIVMPQQDGVMKTAMMGIDIPEPDRAVRYLREVIRGSNVSLRFDRRRLNASNRLQAYVFIEDLFLNEQLVLLGLASARTHASDFGPFVRRLKQAEREAQGNQRGIWRK